MLCIVDNYPYFCRQTNVLIMELEQLQKDCARRQKKGLHFIMASVVIWGLILVVHLTDMEIEQKNLY